MVWDLDSLCLGDQLEAFFIHFYLWQYRRNFHYLQVVDGVAELEDVVACKTLHFNSVHYEKVCWQAEVELVHLVFWNQNIW